MFFEQPIPYTPQEVLVYLRKSRSDQPDLTVEEVLEKHEKILDQWASRHLGAPVPEENKYREIVSGETIADRPQIKKVLHRMEDPNIKALLVVEVQRISRGDLEDAGRLLKLLRFTKTVVLTPQQTYNLQNEYDRDFFERELKRGNEFLEYQKKIMARGRLLSVQQGNYIGSVAPYGYLPHIVVEGKRKCPTLKIDPERAKVVQTIFDLYVHQGMGPTLICRRLNGLSIPPAKGKSWTPASIYGILDNIHYTGQVKWNQRKTVTIVSDSSIVKTRPRAKEEEYLLFPGKHPAIISPELFAAAQQKHSAAAPNKSSAKLRNAFAGLIYCQCGHAMALRTYSSQGKERSAPRLLCSCQSFCHTPSCLYSDMMEQVCSILHSSIYNFRLLLQQSSQEDAFSAHAAVMEQLKKRLALLEEKEIAQWEKYTEEGMPKDIFQRLNTAVVNEKEEVLLALKQAQSTAPVFPANCEEKIVSLQDALSALEDAQAPAQEKNRLLKLCLERIEYDRPPFTRGKTAAHGGWEASPIHLSIYLRV